MPPNNLRFLMSVFIGCFFVSGCDYYVAPSNIEQPQVSPSRAFHHARIPEVIRGLDLGEQGIDVTGNGRLELRPTSTCEAADIVLRDALSVSFSCTGGGEISLSNSADDPVSLLALFVATVEKAGGSVIARDGQLIVTGGASDAGGFGGPMPAVDFTEFEAVDGLDAFVVDDASDIETLSSVGTYFRRGLAFAVPSSFPSGQLEEAIDTLGFNMDVLEVGGARFVLGEEPQIDLLSAIVERSRDVVIPVPAAFISPVAISSYQRSFPFVRFDLDSDTSTLFVAGDPMEVARAIDEMHTAFPSQSRLAIKGLFFSYSQTDMASLETDLSVLAAPYTFSASDASVSLSSSGVISAPFSLLVDHIESLSYTSVISRPSVSASLGQPASFRSGVEVPIILSVDPETGAQVSEYRQTGLNVNFTAVPVGSHLIRLTIDATMSNVGVIDGSNPTFDTRSVSTTVDLSRGDTVLLSGLDQLDRSSSRATDFGLPSSAFSDRSTSVGLFVTIE